MEKRSNWSFNVEPDGWRWTVTRPDGGEERSRAAFRTLKECTDEAKNHGYVVWTSSSRRRGRTLAESTSQRWASFGVSSG